MTAFTLINLASSETVDRAVYSDGKRAAKVAARLTAKTGRKYQVRKAADGDADWRAREVMRFSTGEYTPVVEALAAIAPHEFFAHVAKKSPDLIAYTKDDEKGRHDKQSLLSIGAFIAVCLDHPDTIERHTQIAKNLGYTDYAAYCAIYYSVNVRSNIIAAQRDYAIALNNPIKFAGPLSSADASASERDALMDLIEKIYTKYDSNVHALDVSCMRSSAGAYQGKVDGEHVHPTRAYASPDLAIAYMTDASGATIARALCWPERKIYSRVYAEGEAFHAAMRQLGYRKAGYYGDESPEKSFKDARLSRIGTDNNGFVVPYIDGGYRRLDDDGTWLTMYGSAIDAEVTSGVAWARGSTRTGYCDVCEDDDCDEDNMVEVFSNTARSRSTMWCQHCAENNGFYCNGYEVWFDSDSVSRTFVHDETYSERYVENNASYCDYYEEYTFDDVFEVTTDDGTQMWSERAISNHAFRYDDHYYADSVDHVEVVVERYVGRFNRKWAHHPSYTYLNVNVWYVDRVETVPQMLIDDGEVAVYTGVDGRVYLRDYVDNYPVARERVAEDGDIVESWVTTTYRAASAMTLHCLDLDRRAAARAAIKRED